MRELEGMKKTSYNEKTQKNASSKNNKKNH